MQRGLSLLTLSCAQDPPFGIHLCGGPDFCVLGEEEGGPVVPVHDERVRP